MLGADLFTESAPVAEIRVCPGEHSAVEGVPFEHEGPEQEGRGKYEGKDSGSDKKIRRTKLPLDRM